MSDIRFSEIFSVFGQVYIFLEIIEKRFVFDRFFKKIKVQSVKLNFSDKNNLTYFFNHKKGAVPFRTTPIYYIRKYVPIHV